MQTEVLSFSETAELVVGSTRSWSRHWKTYVATRDFPAPLASPTASRRPRWSRAQVVAWIRNGGQAPSGFDVALEAYAQGHRHAA
jgi:hypothetical protein